MQLTCKCQKFKAELKDFPKNTPGRLKCYCDDCQAYMHHLGRADLLDENGGTEIIPYYPADVKILTGAEHLKCTRLSEKGMYRFSTTCCNTPIANSRPGSPWLGIHREAYSNKEKLDHTLGPIKSAIMGKFAKGQPPKGTPKTFDFKGFKIVMPYMFKGKILGKTLPSPFFTEAKESFIPQNVLSFDERKTALKMAGL